MTRTKYMQSLLHDTIADATMEAVLRGFNGSPERAIAKVLQIDYLTDHSEACELIEFIAKDDPTIPISKACLKAAYLVTSSKIKELV